MSTTRLPELPSMPEPAATLHAPDGDNITLHAPRQLRDYAHAYGLAVWKAAIEAAAGACERLADSARRVPYCPDGDEYAVCGVKTEHLCALRNCMECQNFGYYPPAGSPQERRE